MKSFAFALLICFGAAWAQTTPPANETPQEKARRMASEGLAAEQNKDAAAKTPALPDDAVIAVFEDGTKFTMADFKRIASFSDQSRQFATQDPGAVIRWWAGMRKLANQALAAKLDTSSPTKEQLEFNRTILLGQAMMNYELNTIDVDQADIEKYYEANKEQYKAVRVKALYIAFGDAPGAKVSRTEEQAKAEAARLLTQIRGGADFVKLVKQYSDDQTSREKDGDFATFHKKENIPDAIEKVVFSLKQGEVSEPVKQPNGYYLLRAEEVSYAPESQVNTDILLALRQQRYSQWLGENTSGVKVEYPNPAFPGTPAPAGK